jgi:RNA polymerase sigma-70 factor, ECF subfamily
VFTGKHRREYGASLICLPRRKTYFLDMENEGISSSGTQPSKSSFTGESETVLVRKAIDGDADAFATLFQHHKGRVYAVCLRMTNNTADADDLTQEAFIQAFRKLASFRGESALSTWLHRVAVNTALMHFRKRVTAQALLDGSVEGEQSKREFGRQDERLQYSLDRIALKRALDALPFGYRTIFELHEFDGYGHREIAKILHCTVGNSKSQLHKAKQRIRECLLSRRHLARRMREAAQHSAPRPAELTGHQHRSTKAMPPPLPRPTRSIVHRTEEVLRQTGPSLLLRSPIQTLAESGA